MSAAWFPVARYNSLPLALLQYKWTALPLSSNVEDHWNNYSEYNRANYTATAEDSRNNFSVLKSGVTDMH